MIRRSVWWWALGLALFLAACSPAASTAPAPSTAPNASEGSPAQATPAPKPTAAPAATQAPALTEAPAAGTAATPTAAGQDVNTPPPLTPAATGAAPPTAWPIVEARIIELEWPARLRLGDSDSVRLALVPSRVGYLLTTEFPENQVVTQTVTLQRPPNYDLVGVARLEGVGFEIAPQAEQRSLLPENETVTWRWTITPRSAGQHRLAVAVWIRWEGPAPRESQVLSRSLGVQVTALFGLTGGQALWLGTAGLGLGSGLCLAALAAGFRPRRPRPSLNLALSIEPPPGLVLGEGEQNLMRLVFSRYARAVVETEFRSGYSGARALLVRPILADGRADAPTILKLGARRGIEREFANYQRYVKDTLPPMTARVQDDIAFGAFPAEPERGEMAALRYTFIAQPGQRPRSLREALRHDPDPALLYKLFETFGPNWWQQRKPYTFRAAQEYDGLLPAHLVLRPAPGDRPDLTLDPRTAPGALMLQPGDRVWVGRFSEVERRVDGRSLSLGGVPQPGQPPLRVRWLGLTPPEGAAAQVVGTRETLLREAVEGLSLEGRPDVIARLPALLAETVTGSQSIIHGDLNLENVLIGPGGFVWLIDFAQTRDGHPLQDFAHLAAEIIAHVLAPRWPDPAVAVAHLTAGTDPLLAALHTLAERCLARPGETREWRLALTLACLGALKHPNLDRHARHLLLLAAAAAAP